MPDKIIVLHQEVGADAREDEQDTLDQAAFVMEALAEAGFRNEALAMGMDLERARREIASRSPAAVFNLVESLDGRGEFIHFAAGLLETMCLPFTGSSARALFLTSHKLVAKQYMRLSGIPTPDWFSPGDGTEGAAAVFPCLRKSVWEHASLGMDDSALILSEKDFAGRAVSPDGGFFYERYVEGREFNIPLIEEEGKVRVLDPAEIRFVDYPSGKPRIVGYRAKWEKDSFEYRNTPHGFDFPESDRPLLAALGDIAVSCFRLFALSGYARVDFRVDDLGNPWVLEVNANPCLTPDAGFFAAARRCGFTRRTLMATILDNARIRA